MFPPQKTSRVQSVYISTYQQDILYLKYIFQARKTKSHANQFNHYITKYRRFLVQFLATMKRLEKENNVMLAEINVSKTKKASTNKRHWDFRGHRDDCQFKSNKVKDSSGSKAKFVDVLNHRVKVGDTVLEKHLNTCSISASYISKSRKIR